MPLAGMDTPRIARCGHDPRDILARLSPQSQYIIRERIERACSRVVLQWLAQYRDRAAQSRSRSDQLDEHTLALKYAHQRI